jgi:hypothetical protein
MKYRVFNTEAEALTAEAQIANNMGYSKIGTNAATGLPDPSAQVTERWAIPQEIADGRWVFVSPDDVGVEADLGWWPATEMFP